MKHLLLPILRSDEPRILAGRLSGKRAFLAALERLPDLTEQTLVLLDFHEIEFASSSFLSELIIPLRDHLRARRPHSYLVGANLSDNVREEIEEMLLRSGEALLTCESGIAGEIRNVQLCGKLEDKLQETLTLVSQKRETTASQLHAELRELDTVGATAWNNRLTSLAAKSLVVEVLHGRTKRYRPVLEVA